jgi:hypothetical protein
VGDILDKIAPDAAGFFGKGNRIQLDIGSVRFIEGKTSVKLAG